MTELQNAPEFRIAWGLDAVLTNHMFNPGGSVLSRKVDVTATLGFAFIYDLSWFHLGLLNVWLLIYIKSS